MIAAVSATVSPAYLFTRSVAPTSCLVSGGLATVAISGDGDDRCDNSRECDGGEGDKSDH